MKLPGVLRNRVSAVALFMAIILAVVFLGAYLASEDPRPHHQPIQDAGGEELSPELRRTTILLEDDSGDLQAEISARSFSVESLQMQDLRTSGPVQAEEPRLSFYRTQEGVVRKVVTLEAGTGILDLAAAEARLEGRSTVVVDPETPNPVRFSTESPLRVLLGQLDSPRDLEALAPGPVRISMEHLDVMGTGLRVDLEQGEAFLDRDISVLVLLDERVELPGTSFGNLTITCGGPLEMRRHGGEAGLSPAVTFNGQVKVVGDDGSRVMECERLELVSAPNAPRLTPEYLIASGRARLNLPGTAQVAGEVMRARRSPDGSWQVEVQSAPGTRLAATVTIKDGTSELLLSCAGTMTFHRQAQGRGTLVFHQDVRGSRHLAGDSTPASEWTISRQLEVTLRGDPDGAAIERLTALGEVEVRDRGGDRVEQARYRSLRARASTRLEAALTAEGDVSNLELVGDALLRINGLSPRDGEGEEPSDLLAEAQRLGLVQVEDGTRVISAEGQVRVQELGGDLEQPRRQVDGEAMVVRLPPEADRPSVVITGGTGMAHYQDFTGSRPMSASGSRIETPDLDRVTLVGTPARASVGGDSMEAPTLELALREQRVEAGDGVLQLRLLREGDPPVEASGTLVYRDDTRSLWILEGTPARVRALASGSELHLEAPTLEVDPEGQTASCPRGGKVRLLRHRREGDETVVVETAGSLRFGDGQLAATGRPRVTIERQGTPFDLTADQITGTLVPASPQDPAGAAGVGGPLALGEVVARGRVEVQVGVHRGEGHELRWDARTGQAELTAKPGVLVRLRDGDRGLLWEGVKVTIDEPRGTYRGVGGRFRRDGVSPR